MQVVYEIIMGPILATQVLGQLCTQLLWSATCRESGMQYACLQQELTVVCTVDGLQARVTIGTLHFPSPLLGWQLDNGTADSNEDNIARSGCWKVLGPVPGETGANWSFDPRFLGCLVVDKAFHVSDVVVRTIWILGSDGTTACVHR